MCTRGSHPVRHYVCLPCRASFKKSAVPKREHRCPHCGGEQLDAGQDFPAPKRTDVQGWRVMAILLTAGVTFHSSCCGGPGWRPRTLREVRQCRELADRTGIPLRDAFTSRPASVDADNASAAAASSPGTTG